MFDVFIPSASALTLLKSIDNHLSSKSTILAQNSNANLNVNLDAIQATQSIAIAVSGNGSKNREGFVKGVTESAYYAGKEKYNVLVFNLGVSSEEKLRDVVFFGTATYEDQWAGTIQYGIWIFREGEFTNQGDGGYVRFKER